MAIQELAISTAFFIPLISKQLVHRPLNNMPNLIFFEEKIYKTFSKAYILLQNSMFRDSRTPNKEEEHFWELVKAEHAVILQKLKACPISFTPEVISQFWRIWETHPLS